MKTANKLPIFWVIVWVIFLFALLLMLSFAIPETLEVVKPETRSKKLGAIERPSTFVEVEIPVYNSKVAPRLQGVELYRFYIAQINEQYYPDVDPYIALAVLETESNYNPNAKNKSGATGLMQILPQYHLRRAGKYGLNDVWDPYTNIICGMDFLNDLIHSYGNWNRALLGYNNSTAYVNHVLNLAESLKGGGYFG